MASERSGWCSGSAALRRARNPARALGPAPRAAAPSSAARATMRSHRPRRPHHPPQRATRRLFRKRAMATFGRDHEVLDDVARAIVGGTSRSITLPPAITGRASIVSRSSRPCRRRNARSRCAASSWRRTCSSSRARRPPPAAPPSRPRARRRPRRRRASRGCAPARDRRRGAHRSPRATSISTTTAPRSSPGFSDGGSVERRSGSIGKRRGRRRRRSCCPGRGVRGRALVHQLVHVRDRDEQPDVVVGSRSATSIWSRSRDSRLSIEDQGGSASRGRPRA